MGNKDKMERNTDKTDDKRTRLHNEEVLNTLKPGDLIKIHRDLYTHWAIYIGKEEGVEKVIHWSAGQGPDFRTRVVKTIVAFIKINTIRKLADNGAARIRIDSFWTVVGNSESENGNDKDREDSEIDGSQVVKGAIAFKDETDRRKTRIQFYDGEHFAKWCRYGKLIQVKPIEKSANVTDLSKLILAEEENDDSMSVSLKAHDKIRDHNTKLLDTLKIGDLVKFARPFYYHWAVYIGKDDNTDDDEPKVIHWWGPPDFKTSKKGASIMKTSFWEAAKESKAEEGNDHDHEKRNINGYQVAARAEAKLSLIQDDLLPEKYNILFNNCEHFAKWCRYKLDYAEQVQESLVDRQKVVLEIEDPTTASLVSNLGSIYRKWTYENLKVKEELKILRSNVRNVGEKASKEGDIEKKTHKRIIGGLIVIFVVITFTGIAIRKIRKKI